MGTSYFGGIVVVPGIHILAPYQIAAVKLWFQLWEDDTFFILIFLFPTNLDFEDGNNIM